MEEMSTNFVADLLWTNSSLFTLREKITIIDQIERCIDLNYKIDIYFI